MSEKKWLLALLSEGYDQPSWHGPNLRGSLRRVSHQQAVWRPAKDRKNIWELTLHAAYWKYVVRRRFTGEKRGSFPYKGSNWFERTRKHDIAQWKADLELLDDCHRQLMLMVEKLPARRLQEIPTGCRVNGSQVLRGVAMHDVYHAGQIQLLKKLMPANR